MRKRSESFYAKSEQDFDLVTLIIIYQLVKDNDKKGEKKEKTRFSSLIDSVNNKLSIEDEINRSADDEDDEVCYSRKRKNAIIKKNFSGEDLDLDNLGVEKNFTITQTPPTVEEDESNLVEMIKKMNNSYKAKDKIKFLEEVTNIYRHFLKDKHRNDGKNLSKEKYKNIDDSSSEIKFNIGNRKISRSFTFDNLDSINIDFDTLIEDMSFSSETTSNSFNSILCDPILSKNINVVDEVLKLMVIGEQGVGKSFLINKILDEKADNKIYVPTGSLEIKKKIIKLLDKVIRIEFYDTNSEILNSEICQVYYKICDGIFLIIDPTRIESVLFIEKQIQKLIKYSPNQNFFLLGNIRFLNNDFEKLRDFQKKFIETDLYIKDLVRKYDLKINYINIDALKIFRNQIKKFLCIVFIKKGINDVKISRNYSNKKKNNNNNRKSVDLFKNVEERFDNILGKNLN